MNVKEYLKMIDKVIENGYFKADWNSLWEFKIPEWYKQGRFGLFIHWGTYSVPEFGSEWYPRLSYLKGNKCFNHRIKAYGGIDYRQIVLKFKPDKFDAREWLRIFKDSGAKYIMPVGEHHDGIKMYKSELNKWNAYDLNGVDYLEELHKASDEAEIGFLTSSHRAEHYWFMEGARKNCPDSEIAQNEYADLYGPAVRIPEKYKGSDKSYDVPTFWLEDWLASSCEMIDKNKPLAVYFDWWIQTRAFLPYIKKFLAYYYNRGREWNKEVAVFFKTDCMPKGCAIFDVERGQIDGISPVLWQCDTSTAKNSWGYTRNNEYKSPFSIAQQMIDVVSKNGCFMLNIGPKPDGTICEQDKYILHELGRWLSVVNDAIYKAKPFNVYGEGRKKIYGGFKEDIKYFRHDFRFTLNAGVVNAFYMSDKPCKKFVIKSLGKNKLSYFVKSVRLVGREEELSFIQKKNELIVTAKKKIVPTKPLCFKVEIG